MKSLALFLLAFTFAGPLFADYSFVGIGVTVQQNKNEPVQIVDLHANGPAYRAGVQLNEYITAVDGVSTLKIKMDDVVNKIVGDGIAGTFVTLTLSPSKAGTPNHDVRIMREVIEVACFIDGRVDLRIIGGDAFNGNVNGWIKNDFVNFNINGGRLVGYYKNQYINLSSQMDAGGAWTIIGYLRGSYISWRAAAGTNILAYVNCIP